MKSSVAALTALAALANAYSPKHMHFPRGNGTTSAGGDGQTTLTVIATHVSTIISCAPTVTNCPADKTKIPESDRTTMVVTETVDLTTTVCPVSKAPQISASIIAKHSGKPAAPGGSGTITKDVHPTTPAATPSMTTTTTEIVTQKTVTVTVSGRPVKTVVPHTITSTVTVPCDETTQPPAAEEPTTTTTATSTSTKTVTVPKPKPTGDNTPGKPGIKAEACECPAGGATVTETVTAPASTVYVTMDAGATKVAPMENKPVITDSPQQGGDMPSHGQDGKDNKGDDGKGKDNNGDKGDNPEDCPPDETTTLQKTVTVIPYPTGSHNGTMPTSGVAAPTGYARLR